MLLLVLSTAALSLSLSCRGEPVRFGARLTFGWSQALLPGPVLPSHSIVPNATWIASTRESLIHPLSGKKDGIWESVLPFFLFCFLILWLRKKSMDLDEVRGNNNGWNATCNLTDKNQISKFFDNIYICRQRYNCNRTHFS